MNKSARLAVFGASQLVTLRGPARPRVGGELADLSIIRGGGLICRGGKIEFVGTSDQVLARVTPGDEVVDATSGVVLPGFVDAHTHPIFGGDRLDDFSLRSSGATYQEIAAAGGGIRSTVAKTRAASEESLVKAGERHARLFLENGTTTIEAKSGYGLDKETELRMLRAIRRLGEITPIGFVPTYLGAHAFPPEHEADPDGYVDQVEAMLPRVANERLAVACDVFVEEDYFDAGQARRLLGRAQELGLATRMHVDQFGDSGGARLAAELRVRTADHLEHTGIGGINALADAGVIPVLLPASVYCLGLSKYPLAREMVERGLPLVVATDFNPGSAPTLSMPFVLSLCATQMRLKPEEALTAATFNAACALGIQRDKGSLEAGKSADFTIWDCQDWREIPYHVGSLRPSTVYVGGVAWASSPCVSRPSWSCDSSVRSFRTGILHPQPPPHRTNIDEEGAPED
ncbi:imidazolonepropionase [Fimbriimonas ginsengisoli]|uniref:Imidazolonepropionase n=1 Tax=Fimbriimonas ginsengisoli Gsoil 348 TaxID=661478 RepID=A0A068NTU3_FIMGI|nr:imidazolonepropionase [Fimbriimonas ginsengisoli]AIE86782.1 imidazolonepropionase [Fimbriimonas ginsengisoli Gsoil 348]